MRQATEKEINDFIKYRSNHIALVERIGEVVFGENFSNHDYEKCACNGERLNLYALRNAMLNGGYNPDGKTKKRLNLLPGEHVKASKHHPEYWDETITTKNWDEENPPVVHATRMPKKYLCEMACDWASVALKRNQPILKWFNKTVASDNPRFIFTDNQKKYIEECLIKIMGSIEKEHLNYPGITYNCEQVKSKLSESSNPEECIDSIRCWESQIQKYKEHSKKDPLNGVEDLEDQTLKNISIAEAFNIPQHVVTSRGEFKGYENVKDLTRELPEPHVDPLELYESFKKEVSNLLKESILDIPQKEYAKGIIEDDKLTDEVRRQILSTIKNWKDQINFKFNIKKIEVKGSLLSKRYNDTTDLDVSVYTDMSSDQRDSIIDITPRGLNILVNGKETSHPLDFYILADSENTAEKNVDNLYDVVNNKWIKKTEEYENEIPFDYLVRTCNFFINGCVVALTNYNNDKAQYLYYMSLDPEIQEISQEEKDEALANQKQKLQADLDALKIALHMISSFRKEAYTDEDHVMNLSIEISSDNPHNTINEQLQKILEKFGIREDLRKAVKDCEKLLEENLQEEVSSSSFSGSIPEGKRKLIIL